MLNEMGYSLKSNKKCEEGTQHIDRDEQFKFIEVTCRKALDDGQPVVSVDTKKKENVGNYKNYGKIWKGEHDFERVNIHDFPDPLIPKAIPY
jgi:hypothetical protein